MEETLKLILQKLESMNGRLEGLEQGQKELKQGQQKLDVKIEGVNDKLESFEKRTMSQLNKLEKKIDVVQNTVGDLVEFRGETEGILKNIK